MYVYFLICTIFYAQSFENTSYLLARLDRLHQLIQQGLADLEFA